MRFERYDVKPQWRLVVDYFKAQEPGHIASIEGIAHIAGCKPTAVASIVVKINRKMVGDDGFRLVNERGKGYRIATPTECLTESTSRRPRWIARGVGRAQDAGIAVVKNPTSTPEEVRRADEVALVHGEHLRFIRNQRAVLRGYRPETPVVRSSSE